MKKMLHKEGTRRTGKRRVFIAALGLGVLLYTACGGRKGGEAGPAQFTARSPAEYQGTITLWSWTDDPVYQIAAFNKVYPNVKVEFTQVGEGYDTKIQTIVDNGTEGPDIFVADVKVVKNYIDNDAWENLSAPPYNAAALTGDIMAYTKEVASDAGGNLRALSWQATPGGFWYKRSLAKEYLGVDDPAQISAMMSTWEGFLELAETVRVKSGGKTATITSYKDLWTLANYAMRSTPWVTDGVFQLDPYVEQFFDLCKRVYDNGYDAKLNAWTNPWFAAAADRSLLGYILPTWGLQYVIMGSAPDSMGDWGIASMPSSYFDGGTYMGIYQKSRQKELAWEFIKFVTLNKDYLKQYALDKSDFPCLNTVADEIAADYANPWCAGQNTFAFFQEEAKKIDASLVTRYDDPIREALMRAVELHVQGDQSKEAAIAAFKADVANIYQSVTVK
ncbi:MAG: extracellular solute-binding protein [Treponema sp.]|jgi:ABC-type glycerol-3-phosphate transport system substrate-binding protein|nr:extracellular solute-binding protein [Treponema sp.]